MVKPFKLFLLFAAVTAACVTKQPARAVVGAEPAQSGGQPEAGAPPFTLAISPIKGEIAAGSPVEVQVVTKNTSTHAVNFWWETSHHAVLAYSYHVSDESGNAPPDTALSRRYRYAVEGSPNVGLGTLWMGSGVGISLKPGESHTDVVDVSDLYDLSTPGVYTILLERTASQGGARVKSNTITVEVAPVESEHATTPTAETLTSQPAFSLTSNPEGGVTSSSQDPRFEMAIITKNISNHSIALRTERASKQQGGSVYKVDVLGTGGVLPPEKELGRLAKIRDDSPPAAGSTSTPRQGGEALSLKPGEEWWDTIMLHDFYDLHEPGRYTVQVRRWDDVSKSWVKSNAITLTVTPQ
jgi:hypothetical protein